MDSYNPDFPNHIPFEFGSDRNKKCKNKNCSNCVYSCVNCDKENGVYTEWHKSKSPNIQTFKPYFDLTMNKEVTSKAEIKEYCKHNNMVYAGDKELTQQCEQNKRENEIRLDREITEGLTKTIMERL